jgi:arginase
MPTRSSEIAILGAPLDFGAGRRGVDMGPSALRLAGLNARLQAMGYQVRDLGNVPVAQQETIDEGSPSAKYLAPIAKCCAELARTVSDIVDKGQFPLVLGGDHSVGAGTVAGVSNALRKNQQKIGVIWIDAHADMNTPESSPSGNVHGMPLASCLGRGPRELTDIFGYAPKMEARNTVLIGLRDVDEREADIVRELGVVVFTMRDIDELGLRKIMELAITAATTGTAGFHLSLDMDAVDPDEAPGVGTPVRGGMSYREAHLSMEMVCDSGKMLSMEVVEVNPVLDTANRTALLGVELVMSAMGKKIL